MKKMSWAAFAIDRQSSTPVFEQICQVIRSQAGTDELVEGSRLPPTRALAPELGVSRSTMVTAYEQLVAEGYLESMPGSGYTVCRMGDVELGVPPIIQKMDVGEEDMPLPVPFQAGQPDMRLFPHVQWGKTVGRVCRTNPKKMLVGGSTFGNYELRKAVAAHVSEWRGIEASPHQIIITAGSGDALETCILTLLQAGDAIGLEDPGYKPLYNFAAVLGMSPIGMDMDQYGTNIPDDANAPKLVVLTPSHQYPLGGAMSPGRRLEFIKWAQHHDSWIVEDDYDSEFRYAGRPIPAMAGFDKLSRTIYVGSFSKIFSNSLRLGYIVVPDKIRGKFEKTLSENGIKASFMPQQALAEFMGNGEFYRHLRRMRRIYGGRRVYLLDRLSKKFREFGHFQDHQAGMQIAFHLLPQFKDVDVSRELRGRGVTASPLSQFCFGDQKRLNGLLLGFCAFAEDEMDVALVQLEKVLSAHKS